GLAIRAGEKTLRMIDIGSGAGFPGIPIKILRPRWELTIIDSGAKRISFLKSLMRELHLPEIRVVQRRAEDLAHDPDLRERFDLAFCRAVAAVPVACELAIPFLKVGGSFIAQASSRAYSPGAESAETVRKAAGALGATIGKTMSYGLSGATGERSLIQIKKLEPTPEQFPREHRTAMKKPLA
ncbi:MAG: 16S rRNA (guanine(527)-N(7))-methyltransferase RsmG, partial [Candidatus Abyssubacteria bacterium]|nr:16S rRNA (guanine(527)-N(7))-methyltransferase RsmG [Candidatus Abyssubacteria bacterium]